MTISWIDFGTICNNIRLRELNMKSVVNKIWWIGLLSIRCIVINFISTGFQDSTIEFKLKILQIIETGAVSNHLKHQNGIIWRVERSNFLFTRGAKRDK